MRRLDSLFIWISVLLTTSFRRAHHYGYETWTLIIASTIEEQINSALKFEKKEWLASDLINTKHFEDSILRTLFSRASRTKHLRRSQELRQQWCRPALFTIRELQAVKTKTLASHLHDKSQFVHRSCADDTVMTLLRLKSRFVLGLVPRRQ